ncbi:DUF2306 domain-containing protein [Nocardioidaceae bacterium]|nr:DUF2306 domain-containing protein [Nocardioidaceae bacterium]
MSDAPTALVAAHAAAAVVAIPLGGVQLLRRPRGDARHRVVGRAWVVLMVWVAASSFWIRDLRGGDFSWLHILSVVTLVSLGYSLWRIRAGDVRGHASAMLGSWLGLVIAGVFATAIPDRLVPTFAVTEPVGFLAACGALVATTVLVLALARRVTAATTTSAHP